MVTRLAGPGAPAELYGGAAHGASPSRRRPGPVGSAQPEPVAPAGVTSPSLRLPELSPVPGLPVAAAAAGPARRACS